jgi:hypothetical protein
LSSNNNNIAKDNKEIENTIDFVDYSDSIVTGTKSDQSYQMIKGIVVDLRQVVDQIDKNFKKAKDLIIEIARRLDEGRFCERGHISRRIKEMLQDKIKEGKITSKWIEDCLPQEYKRKYLKSEVSSLSKDDNGVKAEKILIDNSGRSSSANLVQDGSSSGNSIENNKLKFPSSKSNQKQRNPQNIILTALDNQSNETDCPRCKELEDALLRASSLVPADKLQNEDNTYRLPKERHALLIEVIKNSRQFCSVVFDKNGIFVDAKPDVPM